MFYAKAILCSIVWTWLKSALDSNLFDFIVRKKENLIANPFVTQKLYARENIHCRKRYGSAMLLIFMGKKRKFPFKANSNFSFFTIFKFFTFFLTNFLKMRNCVAKLGCHGYRPMNIFWSLSNLFANQRHLYVISFKFYRKGEWCFREAKLDSRWSLKWFSRINTIWILIYPCHRHFYLLEKKNL